MDTNHENDFEYYILILEKKLIFMPKDSQELLDDFAKGYMVWRSHREYLPQRFAGLDLPEAPGRSGEKFLLDDANRVDGTVNVIHKILTHPSTKLEFEKIHAARSRYFPNIDWGRYNPEVTISDEFRDNIRKLLPPIFNKASGVKNAMEKISDFVEMLDSAGKVSTLEKLAEFYGKDLMDVMYLIFNAILGYDL